MKNQYHIHYKNKFPKASVQSGQDWLTVEQDGEVLISLERGAHGLVDTSKAFGSDYQHDLSPLPKEARLYKDVSGAMVKDDKYAERLAGLDKYLDAKGVVLSCEKLAEAGFKFDDKQKTLEYPKA